MSLNVNDLRPGITFEYKNNIYITIQAQHSKSGRGQPHVKAKVKNLRNNAITILSFFGGAKVEKAHIEKKEVQYLYNNENSLIFMDNKTFEQIEVNKYKITNELNFLKEGIKLNIIFFNKEFLGIIMPASVSLIVKEVEGAIKGDSANSASKKAIVETNYELDVPLFIKKGETIIISTLNGKYISRK